MSSITTMSHEDAKLLLSMMLDGCLIEPYYNDCSIQSPESMIVYNDMIERVDVIMNSKKITTHDNINIK